MNDECKMCGYIIYIENGVWYDAYDEDDFCYDEDTNLIGDGFHHPLRTYG